MDEARLREAIERVTQMIVDCEADPDAPMMLDALICEEHASDLRMVLDALSAERERGDRAEQRAAIMANSTLQSRTQYVATQKAEGAET